MYEFFEHTADLGLRVRAPDLETLFEDAARGLFAMVVERPPRGRAQSHRRFSISGQRRDHLLFDWLNELLYVFDTERQLMGEFEVRLSNDGLAAEAGVWAWDEQRSPPLHEVKAITYHGLRVESSESGWLAEVIVDI
jgi:SHS2 domain-containing protein